MAKPRAKPKPRVWRVVLEPEGGGTHPNDPTRKLVRIMQVSAATEEAAREYAIESALAEAEAYGGDPYHVVEIGKA